MEELGGCLIGMLPQKAQSCVILLCIVGLAVFFAVTIYREASKEPDPAAVQAQGRPTTSDSW